MDVRDRRTRIGGDDCGGLLLLAVRSHPAFPETRKGERSATFPPHEIRLLLLALALPLIKAIRRKQAAPVLHRVLEGRLVEDRLAPRIDDERERARVFHPSREKPPAHQRKLPFPFRHAHDRHRLSRRDVVARRKVRLLQVAEKLPDCLWSRGYGVAAAHANAFILNADLT